eukprot:g43834.t1
MGDESGDDGGGGIAITGGSRKNEWQRRGHADLVVPAFKVCKSHISTTLSRRTAMALPTKQEAYFPLSRIIIRSFSTSGGRTKYQSLGSTVAQCPTVPVTWVQELPALGDCLCRVSTFFLCLRGFPPTVQRCA